MGKLSARALGLLVGFGLLCPFSAANAEEVIRVGNSAPVSFFFVALDVGMSEGIFARHGLKVERSDFFGARGPQAIAAGSIDINLGSGVELAFTAKGAPEIGIAQVADRPGLLTIIVPKESPVHSVGDLKGRTLGVTTAGSLTEWMGHEISRRQGWGSTGIKVQAMGPDTTQLAAMRSGQLDSMLIDIASAYRLEGDGQARIVAQVADIIPDFIIHIIYAAKPFALAKPELVRAFLNGWFEAVAYMAEHKPETVAIATKSLGLPPGPVSKAYDELMPMFSRTGRFSDSGLAVVVGSLVEIGSLPSKPEIKTLVDPSFLPSAVP